MHVVDHTAFVAARLHVFKAAHHVDFSHRIPMRTLTCTAVESATVSSGAAACCLLNENSVATWKQSP